MGWTRNTAVSIRVGWPATAAPPLIMEPDWVVEVGGADSTHTSTKADSQAARVTNSVGMEVSMVSLSRSRLWRSEAEPPHR